MTNRTDSPLRDAHPPIHAARKGLLWIIDQIANADRSTCWHYPFGSDQYGRLRWDGKDDRAHRIAWRLEHQQELPPERNMVVMHDCDNMRCCNPDHLTLGRQQQNARDAIKRGLKKPQRGLRHPSAILTADQVREIRSWGWPVTNADLAEDYGVSLTTIADVRARRRYADVPD